MVKRTASAQDAMITGHGDATIGPAGTTLDMQTWGTALTLDSKIVPATDPLNADISVEFLGAMSASSSDSVSLQNYTVIRYPAQ